MCRRGITLIETLIAVAILALLIGLLLAAIQKARVAAVRTQSINNQRQIILATHQLAEQRSERVTGLTREKLPIKPLYSEQSVWVLLIPWVHGERRMPPENASQEELADYLLPRVKAYVCPADPTLALYANSVGGNHKNRGAISYACNMLAFDGALLFPLNISDGTSGTIAYTERFYWSEMNQESTKYPNIFPIEAGLQKSGSRRATFADKGWHDVVPVKDLATGQTLASVRGQTFQVHPRIEDVDSKMPQTPFAAGLPVAFFDGSVRTLSPGIDESTFWSLVTPNGGEVVGEY